MEFQEIKSVSHPLKLKKHRETEILRGNNNDRDIERHHVVLKRDGKHNCLDSCWLVFLQCLRRGLFKLV